MTMKETRATERTADYASGSEKKVIRRPKKTTPQVGINKTTLSDDLLLAPAPAPVERPISKDPPRMSLEVHDEPRAQTPLASVAASRGRGPNSYRVSKLVDGTQVYLGSTGSSASPETLIAQFPATLPGPGQVVEYLLQGLDALGAEVGRPMSLPISGDAPSVVAARARAITVAAPAPAATSSIDTLIAAALQRHSDATERLLTEERAALKRKEDALAIAERTLADKVRIAGEQITTTQSNMFTSMLQLSAQQHEQTLTAERDRAKRDRDEAAERRKDERIEADQRRQDERDRDRTHQTHLATITAASSLENMIAKAGAMAAALKINPGEIIERFIGGKAESAATAAGIPESIAGAIGNVVVQLTTTVGEVVKTQMELQARRDGVQVPVRPVVQRLMPPPPAGTAAPAAKETAAGAGAAAPVAAAPPTPVANPALDAMGKPAVRDARVALQEVARTCRGKPEAEWEAILVAAVAKKPAIIAYCKAITVKAACIEAGATEAEATTIAAKAAAFGA